MGDKPKEREHDGYKNNLPCLKWQVSWHFPVPSGNVYTCLIHTQFGVKKACESSVFSGLPLLRFLLGTHGGDVALLLYQGCHYYISMNGVE